MRSRRRGVSRDNGTGGFILIDFFTFIIIVSSSSSLSLVILSFWSLATGHCHWFRHHCLAYRWGWQANLCMCADYKKPCRSGFKTPVSHFSYRHVWFGSKTLVSHFSNQHFWIWFRTHFQNICLQLQLVIEEEVCKAANFLLLQFSYCGWVCSCWLTLPRANCTALH